MARFIYNANAFGVGGSITRPVNTVLDSVASSVLPSVGGKAHGRGSAFRLDAPTGELIVKWDSAETTISGDKNGTCHVTEITSVVQGLNVEDVFKVDEIVCHLLVRYDTVANQTVLDPAGSRFTGCTLAGAAFDVTIDAAMGVEASDFGKFAEKHPDWLAGGKIHYALGRNPNLKFDKDDYGYIHQPNFGKIYFGEWQAGPCTQSLTMLRFQLGSPVDGTLEVGGGNGNGTVWPPP